MLVHSEFISSLTYQHFVPDGTTFVIANIATNISSLTYQHFVPDGTTFVIENMATNISSLTGLLS
jgi:hypothetical protein